MLRGNIGFSILAKSQLSYSIPETMLRLNKFEKIVPKIGKMKVKREDFRKKGKAFDPPQRVSQILIKEHQTDFN